MPTVHRVAVPTLPALRCLFAEAIWEEQLGAHTAPQLSSEGVEINTHKHMHGFAQGQKCTLHSCSMHTLMHGMNTQRKARARAQPAADSSPSACRLRLLPLLPSLPLFFAFLNSRSLPRILPSCLILSAEFLRHRSLRYVTMTTCVWTLFIFFIYQAYKIKMKGFFSGLFRVNYN